MKKVHSSIYLEKTLHDKLTAYCEKDDRVKNSVMSRAIERMLLSEVDVKILTPREVKEKWSTVNDDIYRLRALELKLLARLED